MTLFILFSSLSIIDKTGKAVQDTNNASLPSKFILDKTSNKYSSSTFPISKSDSISKYVNPLTVIFSLLK